MIFFYFYFIYLFYYLFCFVRGLFITLIVSTKSLGWKLSGPWDFEELSCLIRFIPEDHNALRAT